MGCFMGVVSVIFLECNEVVCFHLLSYLMCIDLTTGS